MKGLILCGGYATRLYPFTIDFPKQLMPIADRPLLDHIMDKLHELPEIEDVYLVVNERFVKRFEGWASRYRGPKRLSILNDHTTSDADKLGAVGDMAFAIEEAGFAEDLLVMAGDNLIPFSMRELMDFYHARKGAAVPLYDVGDLELVSRYSCVEVGPDGRVLSFQEKPKRPKSTLIAICMYVFPAETLGLVRRYLDGGGNPDAPGHYLAWLHKQVPTYGFKFDGVWFDIGQLDQYCRAYVAYRKPHVEGAIND